ncbi:MAG TPA: hypothetical protein VGA56_23955 [Opitutaceae bacterium]
MKTARLISCLLATAAMGLFTSPLFGMSNDDVVKMVKASLGEETIILAIKSAESAEFDTSTDGLVDLKEARVSEAIIQAILLRAKGRAVESEDDQRPASIIVPDEEVLPPDIDPVPGEEYYTRYTFKHERGKRVATNYWRGEMVPINTRVTYVGHKKDTFTIKLVDSGETVALQNVPDFSKKTVEELLREMLSEEPTRIEAYGDEMARNIRTGTLRLGMTKTQVLLTRGYPPGHETPSLDGDLWKYWSSRFVVQSLAFDGDILVEGRGIR